MTLKTTEHYYSHCMEKNITDSLAHPTEGSSGARWRRPVPCFINQMPLLLCARALCNTLSKQWALLLNIKLKSLNAQPETPRQKTR